MRVRATSLEAYRDILPTLTNARQRVYTYLYENGPTTGAELDVCMEWPSAHKRLSELRNAGLIEECGTRLCAVTGRNVIAWDVC